MHFICISGVSSVQAMKIPDVFESDGTITLGQLTPGLGASLAVGDFTGYIDEVRIWDRPHNPTVVTDNFRVTVDDATSDVAHNWNFNEGTGLTAFDRVNGGNFLPVNTDARPKWVRSDLDLSSAETLDAPQMTTQDEINSAALQAAQDTCSNLINSFSLNVVGSSMATLTTVYEALCVQELSTTNDTSQVAAILASAADLYMSVANTSANPIQDLCNSVGLASYVGAKGTSCISCVFGTVTNGSCVCYDSHWGTSCDKSCPTGDYGACNSNGVCDDNTGMCNCHPRHYTDATSVQDFWEKQMSSTSMGTAATYVCDSCTGEWVGQNCEFAKGTPKSSSTYTGMAYGSYLTTFDGVSFTHVTPGTYTMVKAGKNEVQALYVPCPGDFKCRYMKEIAVTNEKSTVNIQSSPDGGNLTVIVDGVEIWYPSKESVSGISIQWDADPYIKVTFDGSSVVVYDSPHGLVSQAQVTSSHARQNQGMFGKADKDWVKDIQCLSETVDKTDDEITVNYAGACAKELYVSSQSIIADEFGNEPSLATAGYSLYLSGDQQMDISGFNVEQGLTDFTFSTWFKSEATSRKRSTASYTIMTVDVGTNPIIFKVTTGMLEIEWDQTYTTNMAVNTFTWYYIAFAWSNDGTAFVYLITDQVVLEQALTNVQVGATINMQSITMTASSTTPLTVDCMRSWTTSRTADQANSDKDAYCAASGTETSLMMVMAFDEGQDNTTTMITYNTSPGSSAGSVSGSTTTAITGTRKYFKRYFCNNDAREKHIKIKTFMQSNSSYSVCHFDEKISLLTRVIILL